MGQLMTNVLRKLSGHRFRAIIKKDGVFVAEQVTTDSGTFVSWVEETVGALDKGRNHKETALSRGGKRHSFDMEESGKTVHITIDLVRV